MLEAAGTAPVGVSRNAIGFGCTVSVATPAAMVTATRRTFVRGTSDLRGFT
jgi:hypothetical protein